MKISLTEEIQCLKSAPLFRSLKEEELRIIALTTENFLFEPGEVIVEEGEEGGEAYIIHEGSVEVSRKTSDGEAVRLNLLGQGDVFGELALFGRGLRTATVTAVAATQVSVISKDKLFEIIRAFPEIGIEMLKAVTARFARMEDRLMSRTGPEK
jgi:CRP/FNR family cyclic AMP-dependent transcriptional regulator